MSNSLPAVLQVQLFFGKESEALSVIPGGAIFADGFSVFGSRIPLVLLPVKMRVVPVESAHPFVAVSFCQNRSSCYVKVFSIALNHTLMRNFLKTLKPVSIHGDEFGFHGKTGNSAVHGQDRSIQNIEGIDFLFGDMDNVITDSFFFYEEPELHPLFFRKLFAVLEQVMFKIFWKNHCRSRYRPGQTPPAGFIGAAFKKILMYF